MKQITILTNFAATLVLACALVPELGFSQQATIGFKSSPTHFRFRNGMDWGGMNAFGTSRQDFQVAVVSVGSPTGPLPSSYDFYAPCDPRYLGNEADEPKSPTVNLLVLSSSSPIPNSFTVPLSTLMRISDEAPLTQGIRLLLLYKPSTGGSSNQIICWDAFKTTQSSLPSGADHFEALHLALAQALENADIMEGCRILDLLYRDLTPKEVSASRGQINSVEAAMIQAAKTAPAYLSYGIYYNLQDYEIPRTYEPMVRAYLALTKDPDAGQNHGPDSMSYGKINMYLEFHEIWPMGYSGHPILPNPDLWESAVVGGTNIIATREVLKQFCDFAMLGSKQNEFKMLGLLDSPDFSTRFYAAVHFAYIYGTDEEGRALAKLSLDSTPDSYIIAVKALPAIIGTLEPRAREMIASETIPLKTQRNRRLCQYFN